MNYRRLAGQVAIVFGTLAVIYLLWVFRQAVILFLFSLAVTAAFRPYVEFLKNRGLSRGLAVVLVYLAFIVCLTAVIVLVGGSLLRELQLLADNLARTYDRIWLEWPEGTAFQQMIVQRLPAPASVYESFSPNQPDPALQGLWGITLVSAGVFGQIVSVLILSIYWSIDRVHFERLWLSLLQAESRLHAREIWRRIEKEFGEYIRSEVIQSFFAGVLLFLGLWALRVHYPILLALFGALAWIIPWLGGILAVSAVTLAGLSQGSTYAIMATGYAVLVFIVLEFLIEPRFANRQKYSSLLSILLIIALVEPFGLMGFIVAPPLAAAIELVFRSNLRMRSTPYTLQAAERISKLRAQASHLRKMAGARGELETAQTSSILQRLEDLVERADQLLSAQGSREKR